MNDKILHTKFGNAKIQNGGVIKMTKNNKCGKCKFFMIDDIKTYICTYHNCNVQGYGEKACNAFEKGCD